MATDPSARADYLLSRNTRGIELRDPIVPNALRGQGQLAPACRDPHPRLSRGQCGRGNSCGIRHRGLLAECRGKLPWSRADSTDRRAGLQGLHPWLGRGAPSGAPRRAG